MAARALRLGLIGAGRWGRNYIRTIAGLDGLRLERVASGNPETSALVPEGCVVVGDWRDVVDAADIDGVIIATPPATHLDIMQAAIARDKPVLVEKPVVQSVADAHALRAALDHRPVPILVDHVHLFHPAFRALCREATRLGPVRAISASAGNHGPYRADVSVLWDWAPHDLAMVLTLVPGRARPVGATCLEQRVVDGVRAERVALRLEVDDVPVDIQVSTVDDKHRWFAVSFDECRLVYRDTGPHPLLRLPPGAPVDAAGGVDVPVPPGEMPLARAVLDFAAAVRAQNLDITSIALGLATVELLSQFEDLCKAG